jgi:hypothetical protein
MHLAAYVELPSRELPRLRLLKAGTMLTRFHSKACGADIYNPNTSTRIDIEEDGAQ